MVLLYRVIRKRSNKLEEIIYTIIKAIAFIIPGSIVTNITRRVIPKSEKEYNEKILEYFIYSFLNFFIWSILIFNIYSNIELWKQHYIVLWILCFIIIFLSPTIIAIIVILISQKDVIKKICIHFNLPSVDVEPSAWDFKFKDISSEWVIVTLKDGEIVPGYLGALSYISQNEKERDIYISEVFEIDKNKKWTKKKNTDGILIKADEIKCIEFFKEGSKNEEREL